MGKEAFGARRSSRSSLSSLQENSSGLCVNEKPDLQMSSPRNRSGFGESGCSLSGLCCVALHTRSAMSSLFFRLGAGWAGVWKATVLDFVGRLKLKASSVLSVQVWELCVWDRGALCLEETPQSIFGNIWLWHSLVAVGKVLSVGSQGGFGTAKPPQCCILVSVLLSQELCWFLRPRHDIWVAKPVVLFRGNSLLPRLPIAVMLYYRSERKPSKSINNKKQTYLL